MRAAVRKLEGVESVDVSVEKASVDITLEADNKVTLPQLRRTIRSNGNETKDATIAGRGKIVGRAGKFVLDLLNESFLALSEKPPDAPSTIVEVTGVSKADDQHAELLTITSVKK